MVLLFESLIFISSEKSSLPIQGNYQALRDHSCQLVIRNDYMKIDFSLSKNWTSLESICLFSIRLQEEKASLT